MHKDSVDSAISLALHGPAVLAAMETMTGKPSMEAFNTICMGFPVWYAALTNSACT